MPSVRNKMPIVGGYVVGMLQVCSCLYSSKWNCLWSVTSVPNLALPASSAFSGGKARIYENHADRHLVQKKGVLTLCQVPDKTKAGAYVYCYLSLELLLERAGKYVSSILYYLPTDVLCIVAGAETRLVPGVCGVYLT